ncbi:MAG: hypothetical protein Kow00108_19090 [Calditrichia bacterium]
MDQLSTTYSSGFDFIFYFVVGVSIFLLVSITAVMVYFVFRYNKKRNPVATQLHGSTKLEIIWTILPTILVLVIFYYGDAVFREARNIPDDAMTVKVLGRMWDWTFEYENGLRTKKLYAPSGQAIKLAITSADVIHSLYIPAFRQKMDAVPGRTTYLWFKPQTIGTADIYCAEYCGDQHAYMMSKVIIMPEEEFNQWYASSQVEVDSLGNKSLTRAEAMEVLEVNGCLGCHSMEDQVKQGPPLNGIFGQERKVLTKSGKKTIRIDEAYLIRSIQNPGDEIVEGFGNWMPPTKYISDDEIKKIVEIIKSSE